MPTLALIEQITRWWDEFSLAKQIFYGIGLTAGLVSSVLMILAIFGLEHDDAIDAIASGAHGGHDGGGIFSIKPLTGFFLCFGWVGGFATGKGAEVWLAILLGSLAGGGMMALVVGMLRGIMAIRSDGTARIEETVGAVGTVILPCRPPRAQAGK